MLHQNLHNVRRVAAKTSDLPSCSNMGSKVVKVAILLLSLYNNIFWVLS